MKSFSLAWHNFFGAFAMAFSFVYRMFHAADEMAKWAEDEAIAFNADAAIGRASRTEQLRIEAARIQAVPSPATPATP